MEEQTIEEIMYEYSELKEAVEAAELDLKGAQKDVDDFIETHRGVL